MKQTINFLKRRKFSVTETLIDLMANDVFELITELPQIATKKDVKRLIKNKIDC